MHSTIFKSFYHLYFVIKLNAKNLLLLILLFQYIYANFIFYSHLKMTMERSKRRDLLALSFITKSISKKFLSFSLRKQPTFHEATTGFLKK